MLVRLITAFLALSLLLLNAGEEQSDWFYRAWQTEDGLPDNSVSGVAQSPDGYLWVGTNGGAIRFNGKSFSTLPLRKLPNLPSQQVREMFMDRRGQLWLGMERGPVIRVGEDSFHPFHLSGSLFRKRTMSLTDDSEGRQWAAYFGSVCYFEDGEIFTLDSSNGIPSGPEATLACDTDGQVWLSNGGKLGRLSTTGFELVRDFKDESLIISSARSAGIWLSTRSNLLHLDQNGEISTIATLPEELKINTIFEDHEGAIWLGSQLAGLLRVSSGKVEKIATSHHSINSISGDQEGNVWAGTNGGGLNLIRKRTVKFIKDSDGLPFTTIRSTTYDRSGKLWAAGRSGQLAFRGPEGWQLSDNDGENHLVNCVAADLEKGVWIGTREHGVLKIASDNPTRFQTDQGLPSNHIRSLLPAQNGDLWIATDYPSSLNRLRDGRITTITYDGKFNALRAMAEGPDGTIWIGSSDGRLLRVDGDRLLNAKVPKELPRPSIRTLHATPDGSLWIGYAGEGLAQLKDGEYRRYTTEEGLFDNYISQILDDDKGSLWIAANRGLFQIDLTELLTARTSTQHRLRYRVFGRSDGLPSFLPSRDYFPAFARSPGNHLYFSTGSGLIEARPGMIHDNTLAPPVILESAAIDGKVRALYRKRSMSDPDSRLIDLSNSRPLIELSPDHDRLVINFAALSFSSPENVNFRYRLSPLDQQWEEPENDHSVTFTRLPAGKYQLQVIACNNAGVWNESGATLDIIVRPFFWETWWFKIGAGLFTALVTGGLVFLSLKRRHREQIQRLAAKRALEQERSRIARDIHDDLGASLTHISLLSQSPPSQNDPATRAAFTQIQSTTRDLMRSMDGVVWAINPEHDTFDELANYLSSYAQEFLSVAGISCRLILPVDLPERQLSAQLRHNLLLAFKEALNNVVKYAEASEVRITLSPEIRFFTLQIKDNGIGIDPNTPADPLRPNAGTGLVNMKNRMDEIGGTCLVDSTSGEGTTIEFKIPFKITP
ncbi:ATP-binding protein [Akkermansiaceae bacterium]|nr:ATP-binding protein [Akkermansiaceae bacterium]